MQAHAATGKLSPRSSTARISECPSFQVQGFLYLSDFRQWRHGEEIISQALHGSCRLPKRGQLQLAPCLKSWQCLAPKPHLPVLNSWILVRIARVGLCHHEQKSATLLVPNRQAVLDAHRFKVSKDDGWLHLSIYLCPSTSFHHSIHPSYLSTHLPASDLSSSLSIYLHACLCICLHIYLPFSTYIGIYLS